MKKLMDEFRTNWVLYLMTLPGIAWFLAFCYTPMFGVILAFKKYNARDGIFGSKWVGLKNFEFLFKSDAAFIITRNTILYNLAFIFIGTLVAITLAIIFNEVGDTILNKFNQAVLLVPHFMSWVVVSFFVYALLSPSTGFVNATYTKMILGSTQTAQGIIGPSWYSESMLNAWPFLLFLISTWKIMGYNCIIYYATIRGFDPQYYEAARIDGASWWQQIKSITVPLLTPIVTMLVLLAIGRIFYADFGLFYNIPRNAGPLYPVTQVIDTYVFNGMMGDGNFGTSAAVGFYQAVVGFILVISTNLIVKKVSPENALF